MEKVVFAARQDTENQVEIAVKCRCFTGLVWTKNNVKVRFPFLFFPEID